MTTKKRKRREHGMTAMIQGRVEDGHRQYLEDAADRDGGISAALRVALDKAIAFDAIRRQAQERGGIEHVDPELKKLVDSERFLIVATGDDVDELA